MSTNAISPAPNQDTPWTAEPSGDGFYRVVNSKSVVLAQKCVKEEAELFAAAPELLDACVVVFSQLTEDRDEYLPDDIKQLREALAKAGTPLRRYRVVIRSTGQHEAIMDVRSAEEAEARALSLEKDEIDNLPGIGSWSIQGVHEVKGDSNNASAQ